MTHAVPLDVADAPYDVRMCSARKGEEGDVGTVVSLSSEKRWLIGKLYVATTSARIPALFPSFRLLGSVEARGRLFSERIQALVSLHI